jgi:hypothetical protein
MKFLRKILAYSSARLALQMFTPVVVAGILYIAGFKLAGFITFQLFIEMFVLWHFAIGFNVWHVESNKVQKRLFVFNMLFALIYRLGSNAWQAIYFYHYGIFPNIEKMLWLTPIHLYASFGCVYAFYQNARWLVHAERVAGIQPIFTIKKTFVQLLLFPWGLWYIQPRLNRMLNN